MDKKRLSDAAVNDDTKSTKTTNTDYGTSRDLKTASENKEPIEFLSCRRILYAMMFFGFTAAYTFRVSLSETIVAMVNQTAVSPVTNNISENLQCPRDPQLQRGSGKFVWDRNQQGMVLAAFYYGYILTHVCSLLILKPRFTAWASA